MSRMLIASVAKWKQQLPSSESADERQGRVKSERGIKETSIQIVDGAILSFKLILI